MIPGMRKAWCENAKKSRKKSRFFTHFNDLYARGKPSTWFPRGWHVETELSVTMWSIPLCIRNRELVCACMFPTTDSFHKNPLLGLASRFRVLLPCVIIAPIPFAQFTLLCLTVVPAPYNREIAKTSKNVDWANKNREWSTFRKSFHQSFSGCRIFLDRSLSESETKLPELQLVQFSAKSDGWIARYHHFCKNIFPK